MKNNFATFRKGEMESNINGMFLQISSHLILVPTLQSIYSWETQYCTDEKNLNVIYVSDLPKITHFINDNI